MNFYLCEEDSSNVIIAGELHDILENGEIMKLSGHICVELADSRGDTFPGPLIGMLEGGRSYWLPLTSRSGTC